MKKTIRTAMTAAVFAAANMSALPSMGAGDNGSNQWPPFNNMSETVDFSGQGAYGVYGPPPTDGTWWDSEPWNNPGTVEKVLTTVTTTTLPAPVYGPAPTTTVSDEDWDNVLTTFTSFMTTSTTSTTTEVTYPQTVYGPPIDIFRGDINMDYAVDCFDVIAVRRMLINGADIHSDAAYFADVNSDGKLNIADLILIQKLVLGKVSVNELGKEYGNRYNRETEIEKITTSVKDDPIVTTIAEPYDPGKDVVITLYGIRPIDDRLKEMLEERDKDITDK